MKVIFALAAIAVAVATGFYISEKRADEELNRRLNLGHFSIKSGVPSIVSDAPTYNAVDDKIIAFLEKMRDQFDVGFPESGIPPLDPFTADNITLNIDQSAIVKAQIKLNKISLEGLQKFIIDKINFKVVGLSMDFGITIPSIMYTSLYGIDGKVALVVPVHSEGIARFGMTDFTIVGRATMGTKEGGYMILKTLDVDFDAASTSLYLSGLIGDGQINEVFMWVLNQLSDDFFQGQREKIAQLASELLFDIINEALSNVSLTDLVG